MSDDQTIIINFARETLVYIPPEKNLPNKNPVYLYFEGPVARTKEGLLAVGNGVVLIVYPALVSGRYGGVFFFSHPSSGAKVTGRNSFAGTLRIPPLSEGRQLVVEASAAGTKFLIEKEGKVVRQVPAVIHNDNMKLKVSDVPAPPPFAPVIA